MTEPEHVAAALPSWTAWTTPAVGRHLGAARRGSDSGCRHSSGGNLGGVCLGALSGTARRPSTWVARAAATGLPLLCTGDDFAL